MSQLREPFVQVHGLSTYVSANHMVSEDKANTLAIRTVCSADTGQGFNSAIHQFINSAIHQLTKIPSRKAGCYDMIVNNGGAKIRRLSSASGGLVRAIGQMLTFVGPSGESSQSGVFQRWGALA